jgi:hypothetical protein
MVLLSFVIGGRASDVPSLRLQEGSGNLAGIKSEARADPELARNAPFTGHSIQRELVYGKDLFQISDRQRTTTGSEVSNRQAWTQSFLAFFGK